MENDVVFGKLETLKDLSPRQLSRIASTSPPRLETLLMAGHSTGAAIVCCSELGFTNAGLSRSKDLPIHMFQNLGGVISDCNGLDVLIEHRQISDVVLLGHYGCEIVEYGIRAEDSSEKSDALSQTYGQVSHRTTATRAAIRKRFNDRFDKQVMRAAVEDFVLRELESLLNLACLERLAEKVPLRCHAWVINQNEEVSSFDCATQTFWARHD